MATRRPAPKAAPRRKAPPPRRGRTLVAVVIGAVLGAGGLALVTLRQSATGETDVAPSSVPVTAAPANSTSTATANTTSPPTTPATTTTTVAPTTSTTEPPLQVITVIVGRDDGPERVDQVPFGAPVELRITNPDFDDEFHLHGYDLGNAIKVPAGETLTLTFVADRAGLFEVESHRTHDVLFYLLVE